MSNRPRRAAHQPGRFATSNQAGLVQQFDPSLEASRPQWASAVAPGEIEGSPPAQVAVAGPHVAGPTQQRPGVQIDTPQILCYYNVHTSDLGGYKVIVPGSIGVMHVHTPDE